MIPSKILIAMASALLLGLAAPACAAETVKVATARGDVTVAANPAKVIVFDLAALDTLDAFGVKVAGVPGSNLPASLEKFKVDDYAKVGSLFEPDYEAVNALEPDLIIIGGRSAAKYDDLAKIAPVIDLTTDPKDFSGSVSRNALTLGAIFGKTDEAEARLARLKASVADLTVLTKDIGNGLILLTTGGKVSAYGPGSRFGQLHDQFGIAPADPDLDVAAHGQGVSFEFILETNPDWLFVIDRDAAVGRGGEAAAKILDNELVAKTHAWQSGKVVYLDPVKMYLTTSGIRSEQGIVDELAAAIGKLKANP